MTDETVAERSVFINSVKFLVASLHLYQEKSHGPVPPGLWAVRDPFCDPLVLQKIKIWSFFPGAEGYEVYLTALEEGDVICARQKAGKNSITAKKL